MRRITLIFYFFVLSSTLCAQSWVWGRGAKLGGGEASAVAVDNAGNCFFVGGGSDTLVFGTDTSFANSSFLVKYDKTGNTLWSKSSNSLRNAGGLGCVATDASGNVYLGGYFMDTIIFYPDTLICKPGVQTPVVVKYSQNGNVLWAKKSINYSSNCYCSGIATDGTNNVYLLIDGMGIDSLASLAFPNTGSISLVKMDSNGNGIWVNQSTNLNAAYVVGFSVAADKMGNSYITGSFGYNLAFNSFNLSDAPNNGDLFTVRYDSKGNVKWAEQSSGNGDMVGWTVVADNYGNSYIGGYYEAGNMVLGANALPSTSNPNIFYLKYDSTGSPLWLDAPTVLDGGRWYPSALAIDTMNHLYLSGESGIEANVKIAFGIDTFSLNGVNEGSIIMEFDTSGKIICGTIYTEGEDDGTGVASDPSGKYVYVGGDLNVTTVFGVDTLNSKAGEWPFIARWKPCSSNNEYINEVYQGNLSAMLYPNPNNGDFTIKLSDWAETSRVFIYNEIGEDVYSGELKELRTQIRLSNKARGIYLYRIVTEKGDPISVGKFILL